MGEIQNSEDEQTDSEVVILDDSGLKSQFALYHYWGSGMHGPPGPGKIGSNCTEIFKTGLVQFWLEFCGPDPDFWTDRTESIHFLKCILVLLFEIFGEIFLFS